MSAIFQGQPGVDYVHSNAEAELLDIPSQCESGRYDLTLSGTELANIFPNIPSRHWCDDADFMGMLFQDNDFPVLDMSTFSDTTTSPILRSSSTNHCAGHNNENLPPVGQSIDAVEAARFRNALLRQKTLTMEDFSDVLLVEPTASAVVPAKRPAVEDSDGEFDLDSGDDEEPEEIPPVVTEPPPPSNRWSDSATAGADLVFPTYFSEPFEVTVSEAQRAQMEFGPAEVAYGQRLIEEPVIDETFGAFANGLTVEAQNMPTYPGFTFQMALAQTPSQAQINQLPVALPQVVHPPPEEVQTAAPPARQDMIVGPVYSKPVIDANTEIRPESKWELRAYDGTLLLITLHKDVPTSVRERLPSERHRAIFPTIPPRLLAVVSSTEEKSVVCECGETLNDLRYDRINEHLRHKHFYIEMSNSIPWRQQDINCTQCETENRDIAQGKKGKRMGLGCTVKAGSYAKHLADRHAEAHTSWCRFCGKVHTRESSVTRHQLTCPALAPFRGPLPEKTPRAKKDSDEGQPQAKKAKCA